MNVIYTPNLPELITNATLVVDACVIIDTTKSAEFFSFIRGMKETYNVSLISIPAVKQEVLSVADNKVEYETLMKSIEALNIIFLPTAIENKFEKEGVEFSIAMRRSKKVNKPSFVDRVLFSIPYLYKKSVEKIFIMTSNHKDVPSDIFDRPGFIARDDGKEFSQVGLYQFSLEKFRNITRKI